MEKTELIPLSEITKEDLSIAFDPGLQLKDFRKVFYGMYGFYTAIVAYGNFETYEYLKSKGYDVTFSLTWPEHYKSIL